MVSTIAHALAVLGLLVAPSQAGFTLTGTWKPSSASAQSCDKPAPVQIREVEFEIKDAPYLNRAASSFSYKDANVTGSVSFTVGPDPKIMRRPMAVVFGLLIGQIVKSPTSADGRDGGLMLEGYLVSREQYDAWIQNKSKFPAADVGEVELQILGSAIRPNRLTGFIRSRERCGNARPVAPNIQDLTGNFGRGVPALWSARVTLEKQ
jgi:hypothetical protein